MSLSFILSLGLSIILFECKSSHAAINLGSKKNIPEYRFNSLPNEALYVNGNATHIWEAYPGIFMQLFNADEVTGIISICALLLLLLFNQMIGAWAELLIASPGSQLGIHRHYSSVYGYTIKGIWGYYEHEQEWMAGPGDLIYETVGSVHTLFVSPDSPEDAHIFFLVNGPLEFVDIYGETIWVETYATLTERYYKWCEDNQLVPYDISGKRGKS